MDYKRSTKKTKQKKTQDLNGKFSTRHVRIQTVKLGNSQDKKIKK